MYRPNFEPGWPTLAHLQHHGAQLMLQSAGDPRRFATTVPLAARATAPAPRKPLLRRLLEAWYGAVMDPRAAYLARATDHADYERRVKAWDAHAQQALRRWY